MTLFTVDGKDYQLKMTTAHCVGCEKRLGKNPLNVFIEAQDNKMPKITDLMVILHESMLKFNHGIKFEEVFDLYDKYCEEGGDIMTLIELLVEVFQEAGFIPKDEEVKN